MTQSRAGGVLPAAGAWLGCSEGCRGGCAVRAPSAAGRAPWAQTSVPTEGSGRGGDEELPQRGFLGRARVEEWESSEYLKATFWDLY